MGILGKFLGALIGFGMGGPLGALIGCWLGHVAMDKDGNERNQSYGAEHMEDAFWACLWGCLAKMAKADGRVCENEIRVINQMMFEFRLNEEQRQRAQEVFRHAKDDQWTAADYLKEFAKIVRKKRALSELFIFLLVQVAYADGVITAEEEKILLDAEYFLNLPHGFVRAVLNNFCYQGQRNYTSSQRVSQAEELENAYCILGCKATDSDETIKKIYRKKSLENHPDRLQSQGMPEELVEKAKEKMIMLNQAYDLIKNARKMK